MAAVLLRTEYGVLLYVFGVEARPIGLLGYELRIKIDGLHGLVITHSVLRTGT